MTRHARMLIAALAALVATLAVAAPAGAITVKVRAEKNGGDLFSGLVNRTKVDLDPAGARLVRPAQGIDCAPDSPLAALDKVTQGDWTGKLVDGVESVTRVATGLDLTNPVAGQTNRPKAYAAYISGRPIVGRQLCESFTADDANTEVLFFVRCANSSTLGGAPTGCYRGEPVFIEPNHDGLWMLGPINMGQFRQEFHAYVGGNTIVPMVDGAIRSDDGYETKTDQQKQDGRAVVTFSGPGPHEVAAFSLGPPDRIDVCVTDGVDGFCGSPRSVPNDIPPPPPAPCATNGRDGLCGTVDTSGPVVTITNIKHKQVFKRSKAPGQLTGLIDILNEPNGLGTLRGRLARVSTAKVLVKQKRTKSGKKRKRRYRTVRRCSYWDDGTALLETAKKCGTAGAKWFTIIPEELRDSFKYSFALKLPPGTYTLEVEATDENKFKDLKQVGRNIITFTVATK